MSLVDAQVWIEAPNHNASHCIPAFNQKSWQEFNWSTSFCGVGIRDR